MSIKQFAMATGQAAMEKTGSVSGMLLGKMANGLEGLAAIECLANAKSNSFMDMARNAIDVTVQKLDGKMTMPFASDNDAFGGTFNKAAAAMREGYSTARAAKREGPKRDGPKGLAPT